MPSITLHNAQRKLRIALPPLRNFAQRALHICLATAPPARSELKTLRDVSVILVSDARIAALHERFMNIKGPTDVITFQHGEIYISVETAQRQAEQLGTSSEEEISLYLVHGLLHLHGFDDKTPAAARDMERMQERVLSALNER